MPGNLIAELDSGTQISGLQNSFDGSMAEYDCGKTYRIRSFPPQILLLEFIDMKRLWPVLTLGLTLIASSAI